MKTKVINETIFKVRPDIVVIVEDNGDGLIETYYKKNFFGKWGKRFIISQEFYNVTE